MVYSKGHRRDTRRQRAGAIEGGAGSRKRHELFKKLKIELLYNPGIYFWVSSPKELEAAS